MTKACNLTDKHCVPCEGGIDAFDQAAVEDHLTALEGWHASDDFKKISKRFEFKGFYKTMAFVNSIAWIAQNEGHHPDLEVSYNSCTVNYTTHAIDGLSENDFICATKIDALLR